MAFALALGPVARAGSSPESTAAEMLDAEATALMQEHRYAEACPKLAESRRLQPGTGVLLRLGLCNELLGKTATAWSAFREAAVRARQAGDEALRQLATKRADGIAPRVPRVVLVPAPGTEQAPVVVSCDGVPLDRAAVGAPIPMDPGTHSIEATLPGHATFRRTFTLPPRDALVSIPIQLPPDVAPAAVVEVDPSSGPHTVALVLAGVGITGVAVGSIFGVAAMTSWSRARGECTSGYSGCSPDALSLQSVVKTDALWSTVGFVGGGAGLLSAALLWLVTSKPTRAVQPVVGAGRLGLELTGHF